MPSFRVSVEIEDVRPGHPPDTVLEVARAAVSTVAHVDDSFIGMSGHVPYVAVRFAVEPSSDNEEQANAESVSRHLLTALTPVARLGEWRLHRRRKGDWLPVTTGQDS